MPERLAQVEDPAAIPAPERRMGPPGFGAEPPQAQLAQLAGAVAALARRVDQMQAPKATGADRRAALATAREIVTELGLPTAGVERIRAELDVARYLTGE